MEKLQIEWGNLHRTEAIESAVEKAASKILERATNATHLIVGFQIVNSQSSSGVKSQKVTLELRLPNHQDIRAEKEGADAYKSLLDAEKALLTQLESKKNKH